MSNSLRECAESVRLLEAEEPVWHFDGLHRAVTVVSSDGRSLIRSWAPLGFQMPKGGLLLHEFQDAVDAYRAMLKADDERQQAEAKVSGITLTSYQARISPEKCLSPEECK